MIGFNQIFYLFIRQKTEKAMLNSILDSKIGYTLGFYEPRHWFIKHKGNVKMLLKLKKMEDEQKFRLDF